MKRRKLTMLLCILSVFAVASVGFAAWLITTSTTKEATGNIVAAEAQENKLDFAATFVDGVNLATTNGTQLNSLVFGTPASMSNADAWLVAESGDDVEKLSAVMRVALTTESLADGYGYKASATIKVRTGVDGSGDDIALTADESKLIATPTIALKKGDGSALGDSVLAKTEAFWIEISGDWGTAFGSQNPYAFYNAKAVDGVLVAADETAGYGVAGQTWGLTAKNQLNALYTLSQSLQIVVTITLTPAKLA